MNRLFTYLLFSILLFYIPYVHASSAPYDEQLGLTFTSNFASMGYNVTPVAQTDFSGYGPAYLLNGYTNTGYWFQVGVSWNWQELFGYSPNQFQISYEVFAPNGTSIFPTSGGGGLLNMPIPINEGDKILLSLYFNTTDVIMYAKDWNTGAAAWAWYPKNGATEFVGNPTSTETNGFFTGLMTEWYHAQPWYQNEQPVTYSSYGQYAPDQAWLWSDEFYCLDLPNCYNKQTLFFNQTQYPVVPYKSYYFTAYNATEELTSNGDFITGATPPQKLNVIAYPTKIFQTDYDLQTSLNNSVGVSVTGGVPPYSYVIYIDNKPYTINGSLGGVIWTNSTTEKINVTKVLNYYLSNGYVWSIGPHYYNITVSDSNGNVGSSPETLLFTVNPDPTITLNSTSVTTDFGKRVPVAVGLKGGTPPYNVTFFVNGKNLDSNLTGLAAGTYTAYAHVIDADGATVNSTPLTVIINDPPTISISANRTVADVGTPISLSLNADNGTPPYIYKWYVNNQVISNSNTFVFSPTTQGQYDVYVNLTDSAQDSVKSMPLTLIINPKPSVVSFKLAPSSTSLLYINNTVNGAVSVIGGTPPYRYKWYVNGVLQSGSNSSSYILNLNKTGIYNISVTVEDSVGQLASNSEMITVSYNLEFIGGIVAVVIVIIAISSYILLTRQKGRTHKSSSRKEPESQEQVQDHIKILKMRYAKGEITKKEYEQMRKDLE
jgi:uncharacterized membrane protein